MSDKEKDADDGENIILSVTLRRDENEKPVIEEERAVPRAPGLHFRSSEAVFLQDIPLSPWLIPGVVSEADAIGRDIRTERLIAIGDRERCGGLYVLGQPRTGKSNLLVRLALSDIRRNHGILFIDPHTDAINDLLNRIPENRRDDIILLDPTDKWYSFGINLLHCRDPRNGIELDNACGRVREVFVKVWGDDRGQLGVWLDKIIRNSVYLLLENSGFTLVDLPLLLWEDTTFRNFLLENVKVKTGVRDFWYKEFDRLTKRERTEQVGPALSRLDIFRNNDMVRDIVGQVGSTIDFAKILRERKIVLLRLPVNLTGEVKTLIGTIVLSEVLYAVFERDKLSKAERTYFGIYCDEFQEFATPDFAKLFTQSGKYKVMPVVAHQTRLGQFKPGDPNQGATLASPNKMLFTLGSADAKELALEFAEEPPTEIRFEEQLVISDEPVRELLRGRHKPEIQGFVDKYLRYLQWKREDLRDDMEGTKFARMIELDTAAIFGAEAQEEGIAGPSHYSEQAAAVSARQVALVRARMHSINLAALHEKSSRLRVTMRELNSFLIEIMEGKKRVGEETFSDFLIALAAGYSALPEAFAETLGLYIKLSYGNNSTSRVIPFELGRKIALFSDETTRLINKAARETAEKRSAYEKEYKDQWWGYFYSRRKIARDRREGMKYVIAKAMARKFDGVNPWFILKHWREGDYGWGMARVVSERENYSGIGYIYYESPYPVSWYKVEHFAPQMDYPNKCAVDFSPSKPGEEALHVLQHSANASSYMDSAKCRKDVVERKKVLEERWEHFLSERLFAASMWLMLDEVSRWYLLMRACDLVMYGKEFADRSFPDPSNRDFRYVVSSLVWLFEEHEAELIKKLEEAEEAMERETIECDCARFVAEIVVSPPAHLEPRVLDAIQIRTVRNACIEEIKQGPQVVGDVAATIDEFVSFCCILAKPENHMRIKGQHVEKKVKTRTEIDMVNEMARVLTALPRYTAYAKVVEEKGGELGNWKGKIRTAKLADVREDEAEATRRSVVARRQEYCLSRERIQEEIDRRQAKWRTPRAQAEAPSGGMEEEKPPQARERVVPVQEESPPPTRAASSQDASGTERKTRQPGNVASIRSLYQSDFTKPTGWEVDNPEKWSVFRRDGYLHIGVYPPRFIYRSPEIRLVDFRARVTAACVEATGSVYGVVFRWSSNDKSASFYSLGINQDGKVGIFIHHSDNTWERLLDYRDSEFIHRGSDANTWTVEMVGEKITVEVNGHALASICDRRLESGVIGLFVSVFDAYAEARFRDFQLYSIASDESAGAVAISNTPIGEIHTDGVWRR